MRCDYRFQGAGAQLLAALRYDLSGGADVTTLAAERGAAPDTVLRLLDEMTGDGTICDVAPLVRAGSVRLNSRGAP